MRRCALANALHSTASLIRVNIPSLVYLLLFLFHQLTYVATRFRARHWLAVAACSTACLSLVITIAYATVQALSRGTGEPCRWTGVFVEPQW